jgi:hypothetical protein
MIYRILSTTAAFILSTQLWAEAMPNTQNQTIKSPVNKFERKMANKMNDQHRKNQRENKERYKQKSVEAATGLIQR